MYQKYREIANYLIVGGLTTLLSIAVHFICVLTFLNPNDKIQLLIAIIISWIIAVVFAYFMNRKFVFESKEENKLKEFGKFTSFRLITLLIETVIMLIGVILIGFNDKIVKIFAQAVIIILNYVFSKLFVFRKKNKVAKAIDQENTDINAK